MKKLISYSLVILVLYAFNYKTISCFIQSADKSVSFIQDYDSEKEDSGSEKLDEKDGKEETKDFSEYLLNKNNFVIILNGLSVTKTDNFLFIPSNYSKTIHLPPELAIV